MQQQLIEYFRLIRPISPADGELISSRFVEKDFREGAYLFQSGRVCREMFFVCTGVIRILSVSEKGAERTHVFYEENKLCTILQSFNLGIPADSSIQACCDTRVLAIGKAELEDLCRQLPYLQDEIAAIQQQHLIDKVNVRNAYVGEDAETQYKLFMQQNPGIALRVPQKDIASYLGITPQSLSRIRKNIR